MVTCEACFEAIPDADVSLINVSTWPAPALRALGFDPGAVAESFGACAVLLCRVCRDRGQALELAHVIASADYRCTPDFFGRFLRALHAGQLELADGWHRMALVGWTRTATVIRDIAR